MKCNHYHAVKYLHELAIPGDNQFDYRTAIGVHTIVIQCQTRTNGITLDEMTIQLLDVV